MRLDLTQASYESIYRTKAVKPSQAKDLFEESFKRVCCPMPFWWWTSSPEKQGLRGNGIAPAMMIVFLFLLLFPLQKIS